MLLRFELPSQKRKNQAIDYVNECIEYGSKLSGSGGLNHLDYKSWLKRTIDLHNGIEKIENHVPSSTYFVIDENDELIGMCNIRHKFNDYLIETGIGHVGYGVRPTKRRRGYAT